jgi:hypothetical protein
MKSQRKNVRKEKKRSVLGRPKKKKREKRRRIETRDKMSMNRR